MYIDLPNSFYRHDILLYEFTVISLATSLFNTVISSVCIFKHFSRDTFIEMELLVQNVCMFKI